MSSAATPTASLIGGAGLACAVHSLAVLNGSVLGCSGLIHRTFRREFSNEALLGTAGLIGAGCLGAVLGRGTPVLPSGSGKALDPMFLLSGLLVGLGSKLQNGCTSGEHLPAKHCIELTETRAYALWRFERKSTLNCSNSDILRRRNGHS